MCFYTLFKKYLLIWCHKDFNYVFIPLQFLLYHLGLRSNLSVIFVKLRVEVFFVCFFFPLYRYLALSHQHLLKRLFPPFSITLAPLLKISWPVWICFLTFLFYSTAFYVCSYASTVPSWALLLYGKSWNQVT